MTGNRTTELLCKLLDERGVEYESHYLNTSWYAGMKLYMATDNGDGTLTVDNLTPEQAITATLGDDDYELKMDELLCRLTNGKWSKSRSYSVDFMVGCVDEAYEDATLGVGKLTAEQVEKVIMSSDYWERVNNHPVLREGVWQAIADELNATMGGGECKWIWVESWTDTTDGRECDYAHWMPDCGCWSEYDHRFGDFDDYAEKPTGIAFCERCGKVIER